MNLFDDTDLMAGEYVLGSLDVRERAAFEEHAAKNVDVAALIMAWERRLAPLNELVEPVKPPPSLWPLIEQRLGEVKQEWRTRGPGFFETVVELSRRQGAASAVALVASYRRWRAAAIMALVTALTLAVLLVIAALHPDLLDFSEAPPPPPPPPLVGVLRAEALAPPFVVAADLHERTLTVRSVPAATPDDRAYAFWLLPSGEASPVPLGRLRGPGVLRPEAFADMEREELRAAAIAASVEPNEATGDRPTAPLVYRGSFE